MKQETKVIELPKTSDQPPQQQTVENKISKDDFRKMMGKEQMLNGKAFESCSRTELLDMILSMGKAIKTLNTEANELKVENEKLKKQSFIEFIINKLFRK